MQRTAGPYMGSNPDFLLGGLTSASAECRHWSGRAVRWSSCAILLRGLLEFERHANGAVIARKFETDQVRAVNCEIGCRHFSINILQSPNAPHWATNRLPGFGGG